MPKYSRKDKITLEQIGNDKNNVNITLLIESNHPSNQLDPLLQQLSSICKSSLSNYKEPEKEEKPKPASKKKNKFNNGVFV